MTHLFPLIIYLSNVSGSF